MASNRSTPNIPRFDNTNVPATKRTIHSVNRSKTSRSTSSANLKTGTKYAYYSLRDGLFVHEQKRRTSHKAPQKDTKKALDHDFCSHS